MCNLSEGIYNIGKEEGKLEAAKIMIESGMNFDFVAKKLELPKELMEQYLRDRIEDKEQKRAITEINSYWNIKSNKKEGKPVDVTICWLFSYKWRVFIRLKS